MITVVGELNTVINYSGISVKGPFEKGTPLYKRHFPYLQQCTSVWPELIHFKLPKRGQPLYKGQKSWATSILYSEVPLYNNCQAYKIGCV